MASPRKSASCNTDNARGNVVPGAQGVRPARKSAGVGDSRAYVRKPANVNASNLPQSGGDKDAGKPTALK